MWPKYPEYKIIHALEKGERAPWFELYEKRGLFRFWKLIKIKSQLLDLEAYLEGLTENNNITLLPPRYYNSKGERE